MSYLYGLDFSFFLIFLVYINITYNILYITRLIFNRKIVIILKYTILCKMNYITVTSLNTFFNIKNKL